jgi:hypothetical protein
VPPLTLQAKPQKTLYACTGFRSKPSTPVQGFLYARLGFWAETLNGPSSRSAPPSNRCKERSIRQTRWVLTMNSRRGREKQPQAGLREGTSATQDVSGVTKRKGTT